MHVKTTTAKA